jgi:type IV pilus assembly protein PilW
MKYFPHTQKGFSLISLMIGMVIGLFLIGAIFKIYLDSKNSFATRNVVAEISEDQRFALDDMRRILVMAGRGILSAEDSFANRRPFPAVATGGIVDGAGSGADTIAIRYRRGPSCGAYQNVSGINRPSMVRFFISDNSGDGSADDLVCELTTYSAGTPTTVTRTLVSGVQMLKALYGVDDNADGYADRYLSPTTINNNAMVSVPTGASTAWAKVVSIRIGLMSGSQSTLPLPNRKSSAETVKVLGMDVTEPDTEHMYKMTTTTLAFRNLNPVIQRQ